MNNIFAKNVSFLMSIVAIAVVATGLSAQAETIDTGSTDSEALLPASQMSPQQLETTTLTPESFTAATQTPAALVEAPFIDSLATSASQATVSGSNSQPSLQKAVPAVNESNPGGLENSNEPQQLEQTPPTQADAMPTASFAYAPVPVPGTTATSAAPLTTPRAPQITPAETADSELAQIDVDPGTPTFGGDSYIGIAGNLGLGGESALGDSSIMVISKIGLTTRIAVRPSIAIENDPVILVPVTFDFSLRPVDAFTERLPIAPFVGGGVAFSTGDDSEIGPLVTAGVDFPITARFTATASVNAAFLDETEVGLLVGIGYNFSALGL